MVGVPQAPLAKEMQEVTSKQTITAAEVEVQCQADFPEVFQINLFYISLNEPVNENYSLLFLISNLC